MWPRSPVVVDGHGEEWEKQILKDLPDIGLSLGVRNDAQSIYVILVTHDPGLAQTISAEFTLWVDRSQVKMS